MRGADMPRVTRIIPTVEIVSGACLGFGAGLVWGILRFRLGDIATGIFFGPLFGLLIGWFIATFTGATGTLSVKSVLVNMVHILWVLVYVFCFVGAIGVLYAMFSDAYGPRRE